MHHCCAAFDPMPILLAMFMPMNMLKTVIMPVYVRMFELQARRIMYASLLPSAIGDPEAEGN
jgi:hypothetical protein